MATRPITTRLEDGEITRLEAAVAAGDAPDRASAIAQAVTEWNDRHDRECIAASYRQRYGAGDTELDAINADLAAIATWPQD